MKAWFVFIPDEWGEYIHAETKGKAKALIMHEYGVEEYIFLSATRVKELDNVPFTVNNTKFVDEDGNPLKAEDFHNPCKCEVCKPKNIH